jgi:carboxylesterase
MGIAKLGVLILHGWTLGMSTVFGLEAPIKSLGLPIRMPNLRGHGALSPEALRGVKWEDWVQDATAALDDLLTEVDHVVIVGHSMGGMLALHLAAVHPRGVDSIITAGSPGKMSTPFAPGNILYPLFCILWPLIKKYDKGTLKYADPELAKLDDSYRWAPTSAIKELFDLLKMQKKILPEVHVPALILQSTKDSTVNPDSANILFNGIATATEDKKIAWFEKTEHGMFQDIESREVIQSVINFIVERMKKEHE